MNNSLTKPPFIPVWTRKLKETLFFIYNGPSMAPLFKPGDLLCAHRPNFQNIHPGDIVIICHRSKTSHFDHIVHRVISNKEAFLITQGDNNLKPDSQKITNENLIGVVTAFGRQGHIYAVRGGILGLSYARLIFTRNYIWTLIKRFGWRIYRLIRQSGLVAYFWKPSFSKLWLTGEYGPLVKFIHRSRTIAHWWPQQNRFKCQKPYDLVLRCEDLFDEGIVPKNKSNRNTT